MKHTRCSAHLAMLLLVAALCGCGRKEGQPKIIRLAYTAGPSELLHRAAEHFAEQVRADSEGRIEVRLYPSGQLGNERELTEGLRLGSVDMIVTGPRDFRLVRAGIRVFEAPFLWRDYAHLERVGTVRSATNCAPPCWRAHGCA
jgi:TRAP-type C4-dicarboxylate transport system substrate-binding protein